MLYAIAVDVTEVDSTEAWWNQSTLQGMAQRPGGVRVLSTAWHGGLVGGVRELSMAWHRGLVGGVNKVSTARCTEAWWGQGALHGMAQRPKITTVVHSAGQ